MSSDSAKTRENILNSAKNEFLTYGFAGASLRKIAAGAGVTTGALYRHFKDKADLFEALVSPTFSEFMQIFHNTGDCFMADPNNYGSDTMWSVSEHNLLLLTTYIYDHIDAFKLLLCASEQTAYENFTHTVIDMEVQMTWNYMELSRQKGYAINEISKQELHMFVNAQFSAFFEMVLHNVPRNMAMNYTKNIFCFFSAGWQAVFAEGK